MKKKIYFPMVIAVFIAIFNACNQGNQEVKPLSSDSKDSLKSCSADSINPNGSSELAILMRKMFDESMIRKEQILKNEEIGSFPNDYRNIKTAIPTDVDMKSPEFDGFADDMIRSLEAVYSAKKEDRKEKFNSFVGSCLSCHDMMCPGPKRKINKLKIE